VVGDDIIDMNNNTVRTSYTLLMNPIYSSTASVYYLSEVACSFTELSSACQPRNKETDNRCNLDVEIANCTLKRHLPAHRRFNNIALGIGHLMKSVLALYDASNNRVLGNNGKRKYKNTKNIEKNIEKNNKRKKKPASTSTNISQGIDGIDGSDSSLFELLAKSSASLPISSYNAYDDPADLYSKGFASTVPADVKLSNCLITYVHYLMNIPFAALNMKSLDAITVKEIAARDLMHIQENKPENLIKGYFKSVKVYLHVFIYLASYLNNILINK